MPAGAIDPDAQTILTAWRGLCEERHTAIKNLTAADAESARLQLRHCERQ